MTQGTYDLLSTYLRRVQELASDLERHNQTLDYTSRADIGYISKYVQEVRRVIAKEFTEQCHDVDLD